MRPGQRSGWEENAADSRVELRSMAWIQTKMGRSPMKSLFRGCSIKKLVNKFRIDFSVFGKPVVWHPSCCASPAKEKGADSLVRVNMSQLMETSASACLVKPKFVTPDVPQYDQRCFPDDDSWLKLRQKLRDRGHWGCRGCHVQRVLVGDFVMPEALTRRSFQFFGSPVFGLLER